MQTKRDVLLSESTSIETKLNSIVLQMERAGKQTNKRTSNEWIKWKIEIKGKATAAGQRMGEWQKNQKTTTTTTTDKKKNEIETWIVESKRESWIRFVIIVLLFNAQWAYIIEYKCVDVHVYTKYIASFFLSSSLMLMLFSFSRCFFPSSSLCIVLSISFFYCVPNVCGYEYEYFFLFLCVSSGYCVCVCG